VSITPEQMEVAERILLALQSIAVSLDEVAKAAKQHREDNADVLGWL
jgi:hypothetical protein